jgi:hypothetical protein
MSNGSVGHGLTGLVALSVDSRDLEDGTRANVFSGRAVQLLHLDDIALGIEPLYGGNQAKKIRGFCVQYALSRTCVMVESSSTGGRSMEKRVEAIERVFGLIMIIVDGSFRLAHGNRDASRCRHLLELRDRTKH